MVRLLKKSNQKTDKQVEMNGLYVFGLVSELGFIIALPLVFFLLLGRWFDGIIGTKVVFTIIGIFFALATSTYTIFQKIKKIN